MALHPPPHVQSVVFPLEERPWWRPPGLSHQDLWLLRARPAPTNESLRLSGVTSAGKLCTATPQVNPVTPQVFLVTPWVDPTTSTEVPSHPHG